MFGRKKNNADGGEVVYGFDGTIHNNESLDVEVRNGKVVGVWFRCQLLPFQEFKADMSREEELKRSYDAGVGGLHAVIMEDWTEVKQ